MRASSKASPAPSRIPSAITASIHPGIAGRNPARRTSVTMATPDGGAGGRAGEQQVQQGRDGGGGRGGWGGEGAGARGGPEGVRGGWIACSCRRGGRAAAGAPGGRGSSYLGTTWQTDEREHIPRQQA